MSEPPSPGGKVLWIPLIAGAVSLLILFGAYSNSFETPFLLDDVRAITGNAAVSGDLSVTSALFPPSDSTTAGRPLLNLSFLLNYAWSGINVWSYHVINFSIHFGAGLILFGLIRRTLLPWQCAPSAAVLAWVIAALWMLHPLQTISVTYLSQRAESLMGFFFLLTLYGFVRGVGSGKNLWFRLSLGACFCGMATKEVMVTAPAIVLLYDSAFLAGSFRKALRKRAGYYTWLGTSWILLGVLMFSSRLSDRSVGFGAGIDWSIYALTETKVVVRYFLLSFWPCPLVFDYGIDLYARSFSDVAPYAWLVATALVTTVLLWRRQKAHGFLPVLFFCLLAPTSSLVPVAAQPMAESRMYLALAPVIAIAVLGLWRIVGFRATIWLGAAAGVAMAVGSHGRNHDFRSELSIWTDTVAKHPQSSRGQYLLGRALDGVPGSASAALTCYERALAINPGDADCLIALSVTLSRIPGREADSLTHAENAVRSNPAYAPAHANLAALLSRVPGRESEALAHYERALRIKPDMAEANHNLGVVLARSPERRLEAIRCFEAALRVRPDYVEAHNDLANELARLPGRQAQAISHYERALAIRPDYAEAHYNLANELLKQPRGRDEAMRHFREAVRLRPEFVEAHNNLAIAYANSGQLAEAVRHLERVVSLNPSFPGAMGNLEKLRSLLAGVRP